MLRVKRGVHHRLFLQASESQLEFRSNDDSDDRIQLKLLLRLLICCAKSINRLFAVVQEFDLGTALSRRGKRRQQDQCSIPPYVFPDAVTVGTSEETFHMK